MENLGWFKSVDRHLSLRRGVRDPKLDYSRNFILA